MKKFKSPKALLVIFAVAALVAIAQFVPVLAQPGTTNDPLVTQRYVDNKIAELRVEINQLRNAINNISPGTSFGGSGNISNADRDALFAEVMLYFETMYGDMLRAAMEVANATDITPASPQVVPFEPLFVPAGGRLIAEAGVEIILRSGHATAISGPDGMVNVTAGADVTHGVRIPLNNLLLVPRSDGRGLNFVTDSWLMIKGSYEVIR